MREQEEQSWHLDKRVPVAFIFVIASQMILGVWWASTITHDVDATKNRVTKLEVNEAETRKELRDVGSALSTIQPQISELLRSVQRVEGWLQRREQQNQPDRRP